MNKVKPINLGYHVTDYDTFLSRELLSDDMDKHTMYSGHSPVDQGAEAAFVLYEKSIALLKRIGEYTGEEPQ